jgi:hypothetical protein
MQALTLLQEGTDFQVTEEAGQIRSEGQAAASEEGMSWPYGYGIGLAIV